MTTGGILGTVQPILILILIWITISYFLNDYYTKQLKSLLKLKKHQSLYIKNLYRNLTNNLFFDVEVFPLGLASKPSIERLVGSDSGASFIPGWAGVSDKKYEIVPVNALDIVINKRFNGQLLVIKMDVEGYENEVLKGAVNTLALSPKI